MGAPDCWVRACARCYTARGGNQWTAILLGRSRRCDSDWTATDIASSSSKVGVRGSLIRRLSTSRLRVPRTPFVLYPAAATKVLLASGSAAAVRRLAGTGSGLRAA